MLGGESQQLQETQGAENIIQVFREETRKANVYFMSLFSYHWLYILILFCIMWMGVYDTTLYRKKAQRSQQT